MDIQQIQYFLEVVQSGSFSEAADSLYTTQSSVSKNIQKLEKELGITLFDRSSRKITLTGAGQMIYENARQLSLCYEKLMHDVAAYTQQKNTHFSVASIPVMAQYNITGFIADFQESYPGIQLNIEEMEGIRILSVLKEGSCNFAFMRLENLKETSDYEYIPIFHDQLAVILPERHPFSHCSQISLLEIASENFLLLDKVTLLYDQILAQCQTLNIVPHITYTSTRMENIMELVGKGRGISLMMEHAAHYVNNSHIRVIPLKEAFHSTIVLVRDKKRKLSPSEQLFWNYTRHSQDFTSNPGIPSE